MPVMGLLLMDLCMENALSLESMIIAHNNGLMYSIKKQCKYEQLHFGKLNVATRHWIRCTPQSTVWCGSLSHFSLHSLNVTYCLGRWARLASLQGVTHMPQWVATSKMSIHEKQARKRRQIKKRKQSNMREHKIIRKTDCQHQSKEQMVALNERMWQNS